MKTDTLFYEIFEKTPDTFFRLAGRNPTDVAHYRFASEEVKQASFRIDAVWEPMDAGPNYLLYFGEVQFWDNSDFYWDLFGEVFVYLRSHKPDRQWMAVAIFANRSLDPGIPLALKDVADAHLDVVYLNEWLEHNPTDAMGLRMVKLIMEPEETAEEEARSLLDDVRGQGHDEAAARTVADIIETILVYKFPQLSREEIEAMFQLTDLRETRVYQEALEEGKREGEKVGEKKGKREGEKKGKLSAVPALVKLGMTPEEAARELGVPVQSARKAAAGVRGQAQP
jgi:predicted transposase/invertase (TIGR01784 family)